MKVEETLVRSAAVSFRNRSPPASEHANALRLIACLGEAGTVLKSQVPVELK